MRWKTKRRYHAAWAEKLICYGWRCDAVHTGLRGNPHVPRSYSENESKLGLPIMIATTNLLESALELLGGMGDLRTRKLVGGVCIYRTGTEKYEQ